MQTEESQQITKRFFEALYALKERGSIGGKLTFTKRYGINRWNLNALEKNQSTQNCVQLPWLVYLVKDYDVSADWLLTGRGEIFRKQKK